MSNYLRNNDDPTRESVSPIRRRRVWLATGVVGLTGAVSLAGVAYATTGAVGSHRLADVKWSTAQQLMDDAKGDEKADRDKDGKDKDGKDRGDWDERAGDSGEWGEHGRVQEVPCDEEKLIEAVDLANRDHGGTLKLAERCTYELSFADKKSGTGLPTIKQDITIKGNDSTIKRDSEDGFRIFRVADGGDLKLKDVTIKDGNASEFKYGPKGSGSQGSGWSGAPSGPGVPGASPAVAGAPAAQGGPGMQMAPAAQSGAAVPAAPVALAAPAAQTAPAAQGWGSQGWGPQSSGSWSGDKDKKDEGEGDGGALLVEHGGSAHLKDVKLTGNNAENNGGAIANFGRVDLEDSKVENNHAGKDGGGVFNEGVLKVKDTQFLNNTAGGNGGGIANGKGDDKKDGHDGSGYDASSYDKDGHDKDRKDRDEAGTVEIVGFVEGKGAKDEGKSLIEDNRAGKNGGGVFSSGGFVKITLTVIKSNTACDSGGGIYAIDTDLKLDKVLVAKNHADKDGGGIVNTGGEDKKKDWSSYGGDKKDNDNKEKDATATISDSDIVDNTAGRFGGGIFNGDTDVKIEEGYQEKKDGKDDNALLTLRDTEIKGNTALNGGGIFNNKGTVTLNDTRVTKNTATDSSKNHRVAGGILNNEGRVKLDDKSTVTNNDPTNCAGTVKDCFN